MPDPTNAYQRSIDQAARTLAAANADWDRINGLMLSIAPADKGPGGARELEYADLSKQLDAAAKRSNASEQSYQSALELADKAMAAAKEFAPPGEKRNRLDTTAGNVLVSITEVADGRGGWSVDPNTPVTRVAVDGAEPSTTRVTTPSSDRFIVSMAPDGSLTQKPNPNYQPDKSAGPSAVPTSEFIYQDGAIKPNPAYRPAGAEINTVSEFINDPNKPGSLIKNPNYRAAAATVNTTAEFIPDPKNPTSFIKNPNYKSPNQALTTGQAATDAATAGTAGDTAAAALRKAQADAARAERELEDAQRLSRQAPTDAQAQKAMEAAQRNLDLALEERTVALEQLRKINPIAAEQAEANLTTTKEAVTKGKLGNLYGQQERIKQIRDLIATGELSTAEGDAMIAADRRGTSVFQAQQQAQADALTGRQHDVSNKNQLASNFSSTFNSGLNTIADMNKYASVGSTAGADAFVALLNMAQERSKQYELPPMQQTDYLGPGQLINRGAAPLTANSPPIAMPPPSPVGAIAAAGQQALGAPPAPGGGGVAAPITINIGGAGGGASTPPPQPPQVFGTGTPGFTPAAAETSAQSTERNNLGGLIKAAGEVAPVNEDDILSAYGVRG